VLWHANVVWLGRMATTTLCSKTNTAQRTCCSYTHSPGCFALAAAVGRTHPMLTTTGQATAGDPAPVGSSMPCLRPTPTSITRTRTPPTAAHTLRLLRGVCRTHPLGTAAVQSQPVVWTRAAWGGAVWGGTAWKAVGRSIEIVEWVAVGVVVLLREAGTGCGGETACRLWPPLPRLPPLARVLCLGCTTQQATGRT